MCSTPCWQLRVRVCLQLIEEAEATRAAMLQATRAVAGGLEGLLGRGSDASASRSGSTTATLGQYPLVVRARPDVYTPCRLTLGPIGPQRDAFLEASVRGSRPMYAASGPDFLFVVSRGVATTVLRQFPLQFATPYCVGRGNRVEWCVRCITYDHGPHELELHHEVYSPDAYGRALKGARDNFDLVVDCQLWSEERWLPKGSSCKGKTCKRAKPRKCTDGDGSGRPLQLNLSETETRECRLDKLQVIRDNGYPYRLFTPKEFRWQCLNPANAARRDRMQLKNASNSSNKTLSTASGS